MKRERFRKQDKTKKCSFCKYPAVITIPLGKAIRRLCKSHLIIYESREICVPVTFTKASKI